MHAFGLSDGCERLLQSESNPDCSIKYALLCLCCQSTFPDEVSGALRFLSRVSARNVHPGNASPHTMDLPSEHLVNG
jgi:hypothetical protein